MKQANRPAFWLALEAIVDWQRDSHGNAYSWKVALLPDGFECGSSARSYPNITWCDPHNNNGVLLEVLRGSWYAVAAKYTTQERAHYEWTNWFLLTPKGFRSALISAICKLANLEDE